MTNRSPLNRRNRGASATDCDQFAATATWRFADVVSAELRETVGGVCGLCRRVNGYQ